MATMNSGLGGPAGFGETLFSTATLAAGDLDDGSVQVDLTPAFGAAGIDFFGTTYTELYVNSNGLITFEGPETSYSPSGVAGLADPAIAPFWTDVDISNGGEIYIDVDDTNGKITVTWLDVHAFRDDLNPGENSFQIVLTSLGDGDFDIEYIYEDIQWTDGGFGTAEVGITDGGTIDFELSGSGDGSALANFPNQDFGGGDGNGAFSLNVSGGQPDIPIGRVDGTDSDDTIGLGFSDNEGELVTTSADTVYGGDGNDSIDADEGSDIIVGGAGSDTIASGGGAATVSATTVNNGDDFQGTTSQDVFSWSAGTNDSATIRFNNSAGSSDGDGIGDFVIVETTNETGTLTIGDFDMGTDKIVLQENHVGLTQNTSSGVTDVTITYANGNDQIFTLFHGSGSFDTGTFTTTPPAGVGNPDDDTLYGGDGADRFVMEDEFGNDTIFGGAGNDDTDTVDLSGLGTGVTATFSGSEDGSFTDGNDTATFDNVEAILGSDQADTLDGGSDASGISLGGGAGSDLIYGGSGNDTLSTGTGEDTLFGGAGEDLLQNSAGNDTLIGGAGNDSLLATAGNDHLYGGDGNDSLDGGIDDDTLFAGIGNDDLQGGTGSDLVEGGLGKDTVAGGAGEDVIHGDTDDAYRISAFRMGVDFTINSGTFEGGANNITLSIASTGTATFLDSNGSVGGDSPDETFTDDDQLILIDGQTYRVLQDDTADFTNDVTGDTYTFAILDVDLDGSGTSAEAGEDGTFLVQIAGPTIPDGANLTAVNGTTNGNPSDLALTSVDLGGDDDIAGGDGNDTIYAGAGNDTIAGGTDNDLIYGGDGRDTIVLDDNFGDDQIFAGDGGTDGDVLDASAMGSGVTIDFSGQDDGNVTDGTDTALFDGIEDLVLTDFNDSVDAGSANNTDNLTIDARTGDDSIHTGGAFDLIYGGDGEDIIDADSREDTVYGGAGNDSLNAHSGNDTLYGGAGNDTLEGTFDANTLYGGTGNDIVNDGNVSGTLYGGDGEDLLDGDQGSDTIFGGAGNDTLLAGFGSDTFDGGSGIDTYDIAGSGVSGFAFNIDLDAGTDTFGNVYTEIENVLGGTQADSISGNGSSNVLYGAAGDDTLNDGGGSDTLYGGAGNDTLVETNADSSGSDLFYGGAGNDRIDISNGGDTAFGGDGADTFLSLGSSLNKTVTGGEGGTDFDTLSWAGESDAADSVNVTFSASETGAALIRGQTVTFSEVEAFEGTQADDTFNATNDTAGTSIDGQAGNDTIAGGTGSDILYGDDGEDEIDGGSGADTLYGGADSDDIDGASGDDTIYGGAGNDTINDDTGSGVLFGDAGSDLLFGGSSGTETFYGGSGNDVVFGGSGGNDTFFGGTGNDELTGSVSNDTIYGGAGNDTLTGFGGFDSIDGGDDVLYGGDGSDLFEVESTFGTDTLYGGEGGIDLDTIDLSGLSAGVTVTFTGDEQGTVTDGTNTLAFFGFENIILTDQDDLFDGSAATTSITVDAGAGNDTVYGGDATDTISLGSGNDVYDLKFFGGGPDYGDDVVYGGVGNDEVDFDALFGLTGTIDDDSGVFSHGNDTFTLHDFENFELTFGGDSVDASANTQGITLFGRDGELGNPANPDTLIGGSGDDRIIMADGDAIIYAGAGDDSISGINGNDTVFFLDGFGDDILDNKIGNDTADFRGLATQNVDIVIDGSETATATSSTDSAVFEPNWEVFNLSNQNDRFDGSLGTDARTVSGLDGNDSIAGGAGDDSFAGDIGNDTLSGGAGSDVIFGGVGNDTLSTGTGNDTLFGGTGEDLLQNSSGDDTLDGGTGNDTLVATLGNDLLYGGTGNDDLAGGVDNDTLYGGTGGDTLAGGAGNDLVYGGDDQDTILIEDGFGTDTIYGGEGGTGSDTLDLTALGTGITVTFTGDEQGTFTDGTDTGTFFGIENIVLTEQDDDFDATNDTVGVSVDGRAGNDSLTTGNGDDTLTGGTGDDEVDAGAGNDIVYGGSGSETLDGGAGNDALYGGDDADTFIVDEGNGTDAIYGGEGGVDSDTLDFSAISSATDPNITFTGGQQGTFSAGTHSGSFEGIETFILNVGSNTFDATGETAGITVFGGTSGRDTLTGGSGDDLIYGSEGTGDDLNGGGGSDTLYGTSSRDDFFLSAGNDTVFGGGNFDDLLADGSLGPFTVTWTDSGDFTATSGSGTTSFNADDGGFFILSGGASNDVFDGSGSAGRIVLQDFEGGADIATGSDFQDFIDLFGRSLTPGEVSTIFAGDGDDFIEAELREAILYGGDGEDNVSSFHGGDATLYGGAGNDDVFGGIDDQTLYGGSGNDRLRATAGNDTIFGGSGADTLEGGSGNDVLEGGIGNDLLDAGDDQDTILIEDGFGADTIYGGEGGTDSDTLDLSALGVGVTITYTGDEQGTFTDGTDTGTFFGIEDIVLTDQNDNFDASNDTIGIGVDGRAGDDTLIGGDDNASNDTLIGGTGNDTLMGQGGQDSLYGGDGNDSIDGGDHEDVIYGGGGNDVIEAGEEDSVGDSDLIYAGNGNDTITSAERDEDSDDTFYGGLGDDAISATGGDNALYGGDGSDTLTGGRHAETLYGGDDQDTFVVTTPLGIFGNDTIYGGEGGTDTDTLDFSALGTGVTVTFTGDEQGTFTDGTDTGSFFGIENIVLTDQNDDFDASNDTVGVSVDGRGGNDTLTTNSGNDVVYGGSGTDTLNGANGNDTLYGGDDADRILAGFGNDTVFGGTQDDVILSQRGDNLIYGGDDADTLFAGTGADAFYGGDGDDRASIGSGTLDYYGGSGSDRFDVNETSSGTTFTGGESTDDLDELQIGSPQDVSLVLSGDEAGDFTLSGGILGQFSEVEQISTSSGNDFLDASAGTSGITLIGNAGNDTIISGAGDDSLFGGDDADVFSLTDGFGSDVIFAGSGGVDIDTLELSSLGSGVSVTLTGSSAGNASDGTDTAQFQDVESFSLTTQSDLFDGSASSGTQTISGDAGNDSLTGGSGDDTISGGTGNDGIYFGDGENLVYGGDGNDFIDDVNGNPGFTANNTIYGGDGRDTVFATDGVDTIFGGADRDVLVAGFGDDIVDAGTGNDTIDGGVGNDSIGGGVGNDQLSGNQGNDTLTGGAGNDTFFVSNNGGDDTVTDFATGDEIDSSALTDASNVLTNQDGTVTADEVTVTGGGGSDQILTFPNGETLTVPDGTVDQTSTATQFASLVAMGVPPCFAPGTLIETPDGPCAVEDLHIGDLVITADHGPQPLRWMGKRTERFNSRDDKQKPIEIKAGALGSGLPRRTLVVSPMHRMVLSGRDVENVFEQREVLALAKALTGWDHIRRMNGKTQIEYYALLFDRHEIIFAEGAATESFRPGHVAMAGFEPHIHEQIYKIYPKLRFDPVGGLGPPARQVIGRAETENFVRGFSACGRTNSLTQVPDTRSKVAPSTGNISFEAETP